MEVLVKNPFILEVPTTGLTPSFWSDEVFYANSDFSMGSLMEWSDLLRFSPFLFIDPKISFLVSQAEKGETYGRGLGALGLIATYFQTRGRVSGKDKNEKYEREYLPSKIEEVISDFDQVIVYGESTVDLNLWNRLKPGGWYLLGNTSKLSLNVDGEPFGRHWPLGMPTEFGWKFQEPQLGLGHFEFMKLKK